MHVTRTELRRIFEVCRAEGCPGAARLMLVILLLADGYGRTLRLGGPAMAELLATSASNARGLLMALRSAGLVESVVIDGRWHLRRGPTLYEYCPDRQRKQPEAAASSPRPQARQEGSMMQALIDDGANSLGAMAPYKVMGREWHRYPRREIPFAARDVPPLSLVDAGFWLTVDHYIKLGLIAEVERDGVRYWREGPALSVITCPSADLTPRQQEAEPHD